MRLISAASSLCCGRGEGVSRCGSIPGAAARGGMPPLCCVGIPGCMEIPGPVAGPTDGCEELLELRRCGKNPSIRPDCDAACDPMYDDEGLRSRSHSRRGGGGFRRRALTDRKRNSSMTTGTRGWQRRCLVVVSDKSRTDGKGRLAIVGPFRDDIDTRSLGGPHARIEACVDWPRLLLSLALPGQDCPHSLCSACKAEVTSLCGVRGSY